MQFKTKDEAHYYTKAVYYTLHDVGGNPFYPQRFSTLAEAFKMKESPPWEPYGDLIVVRVDRVTFTCEEVRKTGDTYEYLRI
jgi:hypothetical protein